MIKYLFLLLFILFIQGLETGFAQSGEDSIVKIKVNDSPNIHFPGDPLREVSQRQLNSYLKSTDYAYANDPSYWHREESPKPGILTKLFNGRIFQWIIFTLIGGILLYGIFQLASENNLMWLNHRGKQSKSGKEPSAEAITDYENLIRKCQLEENYRLAVRYLYLRLIQKVHEKGVIQIRDSSTNSEIIRAFITHPGVDDFRYLAKAYEYVFYGDFFLSEDLFYKIKNRFDDFHQTLSD
jgi:hypothetical protein